VKDIHLEERCIFVKGRQEQEEENGQG
jgi:hypothetical protein